MDPAGKKLKPSMAGSSLSRKRDGGTVHAMNATTILIMSNRKKPVRGTDWSAIFKRRPDLTPPGYIETVTAIQKEKANEKPKD